MERGELYVKGLEKERCNQLKDERFLGDDEYRRLEGAKGSVKKVAVGRVYKIERHNKSRVTAVLFDTAHVFVKQEIIHTFIDSRGMFVCCNDSEISLSEGKFDPKTHEKVFRIYNNLLHQNTLKMEMRNLGKENERIKADLQMIDCYACHGTGKVTVWPVSTIPIWEREHEAKIIDCDQCGRI